MNRDDETINKLENTIKNGMPALVIARVPNTTLREFKDIAYSEFSGDYGMTLKCLWDYYKGENRSQRLNNLESRIEQLEMTLGEFISNQDDKKNNDGETMLDGSTRK